MHAGVGEEIKCSFLQMLLGGRSKVIKDIQEAGKADFNMTASSLCHFWTNRHSQNQVHYTHQDSDTPFFSLPFSLSLSICPIRFPGMPSSGSRPWRLLPVLVDHNAHLLSLANFKFHNCISMAYRSLLQHRKWHPTRSLQKCFVHAQIIIRASVPVTTTI